MNYRSELRKTFGSIGSTESQRTTQSSEPKARPEAPGASRALWLSRPPKILCVDDEPDALELLRWSLATEGFAVNTAKNGNEALLQVDDQLPDCIITDYAMPGITGLQLCKSLRARSETRHIPIILYSAFTLPSQSTNYDRAFVKPTDPTVLACEIRSLLCVRH